MEGFKNPSQEKLSAAANRVGAFVAPGVWKLTEGEPEIEEAIQKLRAAYQKGVKWYCMSCL